MSHTGTGGRTKGIPRNRREQDAGQESTGTLMHSTTLVTTEWAEMDATTFHSPRIADLKVDFLFSEYSVVGPSGVVL